MESFEDKIIIVYSLAALGTALGFIGYHFRAKLMALGAFLRKPFLKHLSYKPILRSQHFKLQWTRANVLAEAAYLGLNAFWVCFKVPSLSAASRRAANLCVVNLIFLCATPHIDAMTNTLGLRWRTVRRLHGTVGVLTALLLIFHVVAFMTLEVSFAVAEAKHAWAVVAAACIVVSVAISLPVIRNRWYEAFLRVHECLVIVAIYGIWVHLSQQPLLPRFHLYALVGGTSLSTVFLGIIMIYRNGVFHHQLPRADIMSSKGAVLVRVVLSRPVRVKAGQYISLWLFIPSTSLHSLVEYHPFVVASWSDAPVNKLDLLIEPRAGLTRHLLHRSRMRSDLCRALFSGPHGNSIPVGDYEVVLMVATGYGIAAQLPYLKQLVHEYNSRKARCRRIHLVWELKTLDLAVAIESLLNNALNDDTLDNGYILKISVYVENAEREERISRRAEVLKGVADWYAIIKDEVAGKNIRRVQEEASTREDLIVTVSASPGVRRDLQAIVQKYVDDRVELVELDYQPA